MPISHYFQQKDRNFLLMLRVFLLMLFVGASTAQAGLFDQAAKKSDGPLPVEEAFVFEPIQKFDGQVLLHWTIPEGYYLYLERISVKPSDTIEIVSRVNSDTETKDDPLFGTVEVYHNAADVELQLRSTTGSTADGVLQISYQGCWEGGICYPPVKTELSVTSIPAELKAQPVVASSVVSAVSAPAQEPPRVLVESEQDRFASLINSDSLLVVLGAFFIAGLALSFTPCVFPMIPIISSIIAGHGHRITTGRALFLSSVYVLSVSVTYTIAGVLAGLFGENLQATFQNPWVISVFSAIFVLLSLSMFGFYDLQLPSRWQSKLNDKSNHQQGGTVTGVAIMGLLSALIVGPCMAAPLAGALIYIGQTGDPVMGGLALFTLSLGMGVPLLLVGASAGKLLPKAGLWMDAIKAAFGVALLLMAIWMLSRIVPIQVTMGLTAVVLIVSAIYMRALDAIEKGAKGWHRLWKGVGMLLLVYGISLLLGLFAGSQNILYPLKGVFGSVQSATSQSKLSFVRVTSIPQLEPIIKDAKAKGRPVMLDFYADWCISCIELEQVTFADTGVQQALADFVRVKVDVTENDAAAIALNKAYKVIGPPALIFYDANGQLRPEMTLIGVIDPKDFLQHINNLMK